MAERKISEKSLENLRKSNQESNLLTREAIETALLQLLEKKELAKISISELVQRAGVSRAAFYRNYESKEAILESVFKRSVQNIMEQLGNYDVKNDLRLIWVHLFHEAKKVREHINFVFGGERSLYWRLSARDNLAYFADLYKIPRKAQNELIENLIKRVGLSEFIDKKVETFSKGMKQRLQIARSLLNNPKIIFLDEPSIGLDPIGAKELRELIKELAKDGVTILLTTHYMPEAEELCNRIAIIKKGELLALDDVVGLQNLVSYERKEEIKTKKIREQEERNKQNLEITLEDIYIELLEEK